MKYIHRISRVNTKSKTGLCSHCGKVKVKKKTSRGYIYWACKKEANRVNRRYEKRTAHRKAVGRVCDRCGFVPEHICQLDVHHRDGNHKNNKKRNLRTLCACCHRLFSCVPHFREAHNV